MQIWVWWILGLIPSLPFLLLGPRLLCFVRTRWLSRVAREAPEPQRWPAVSVLVAARDEEAKIEAAVTSLAALDYPDLEVIAVDDRSRDRSGAILDSIAAAAPHVRALHVRSLPGGWVGKPHALHQASLLARGEYLLFTDADVIFERSILRLAMRHVVHLDLDHFCVLPKSSGPGYWERVTLAFFGFFAFLASQVWAVRNPRSRMHTGLGAFNLVRASTYRAFGGHEFLRAEVLDDAWLGRAAKAWGGRCDVMLALDLLSVRWHEGAFGIVRGLEKNLFAALRFAPLVVPAVSLVSAAALFLPIVMCVLLADSRALGFALGSLITHVLYMEVAAALGCGRICVFGFLFGMDALLLALWRSMITTLAQGGVTWRDTFYPLAELRAEARRVDRAIEQAFRTRLGADARRQTIAA